MNITTIVTQMMILLLIMIVGFVGAKKNVFNDEVNVYASNILLKIGIPGLIISSVKNGSPFTGNELFNVLIIFSIFVIFTGIVSKIIVEVLHIQENKALWQFIKQSKNTHDFSHEMNFYAFGFSQLSTKYETTKPPAMRVVSKNVIQNNHHSFYNEGVQAIKIRKNGDYNG